jgi:hypothetical protein
MPDPKDAKPATRRSTIPGATRFMHGWSVPLPKETSNAKADLTVPNAPKADQYDWAYETIPPSKSLQYGVDEKTGKPKMPNSCSLYCHTKETTTVIDEKYKTIFKQYQK